MPPPPGLGVWDLGFWALGSGSEIWGLGLGVCDLGSGIWVLGFGVWFWGLGSGFGSGRWSVIWSGGIGTRKLRAGGRECRFYAHGRCETIVLPEARATFWPQFLGLDCGSESGVFARGDQDFGPRSGRITSASDTHVPKH